MHDYRKRWFVICLVAISLICLAFVGLIFNGQNQLLPDVEVDLVREDVSDQLERQDRPSKGAVPITFQTDVHEPLTLKENDLYHLYVSDNQLYIEVEKGDPDLVYSWKETRKVTAWLSDGMLLLGDHVSQESVAQGYWNSIRLPVDQTDVFFKMSAEARVKTIEIAHVAPEQVQAMHFFDQYEIFLLSTIENNFRRDYLYEYGASDIWYVNVSFSNEDDLKLMQVSGQGESTPSLTINKIQTYPTNSGDNILTLEDALGTIVYLKSDTYHYVWRYLGMAITDAKIFSNIQEQNVPALLFEDRDGHELMTFIDWSYGGFYRALPQLWEENWVKIDRNSFFQVGQDRIRVLKYKEHGPDQNNDAVFVEYVEHEIPILDAAFVSQNGGLLEFNRQGHKQYLSIYDLVAVTIAEELVDLDQLWISSLAQEHIEQGVRTNAWVEEKHRTIQLPKHLLLESYYHVPDAPQELLEAYDRIAGELGDYAPDLTVEQINGVWYVLVDQVLYQFVEGELQQLAELPITRHTVIGEGVSGFTAQAFTLLGEDWVFADTFGHRLLKLNSNFDIIAQEFVPYPYELKRQEEKGHLYVKHLSGHTVFTADLRTVSNAIQEWSRYSEEEATEGLVEYYLSNESYLEDQETGLTWVTPYGKVIIFDTKQEQVKDYFIGYLKNARAKTSIIPLEKQMLVFHDHELHVFQRSGEYERTISFPRSEPDGIYSLTTIGEHSFVLDQEQQTLYLVQGFKILKIDLGSDEVDTIFYQPYADMGPIALADQELFFTLQSDINVRYMQSDQDGGQNKVYQLITLDLQTNKHKRFLLDDAYQVVEISEDQILMQIDEWGRARQEEEAYMILKRNSLH